jgi:hypothetical protein
MDKSKKNTPVNRKIHFHTSITALVDRSVGGVGLLSIGQIMSEKIKLKNMRNGKANPQ